MSKIIILLQNFNNSTTGGQKYDSYFTHRLKKLDQGISIITDNELIYNSRFSFMYNLIYVLKFKTFLKADVIITNSRLYPRLFFLITFLKVFNKKIKLICIHHHYNFLIHKGFKRRVNKYFEITFLKKFNGIIIPSKYIKQITKNYLPKQKIFFLEIGFKKTKNKPHSKPYNNNLIYVGTIEKRKGLHLLIDALKDVNKTYKLSLIGKYDEKDYYYLSLVNKIMDYGLEENVIFTGRLSDEQLKAKYLDASVFVFPSLHEGYGMVMVEAMQYGLPVIAFNNSAMPYIVKNGINGFLVKNLDTADLTEKLNIILTNKNLLAKLRTNIIESNNNIRELKDLNQDIEEFYNQVIN